MIAIPSCDLSQDFGLNLGMEDYRKLVKDLAYGGEDGLQYALERMVSDNDAIGSRFRELKARFETEARVQEQDIRLRFEGNHRNILERAESEGRDLRARRKELEGRIRAIPVEVPEIEEPEPEPEPAPPNWFIRAFRWLISIPVRLWRWFIGLFKKPAKKKRRTRAVMAAPKSASREGPTLEVQLRTELRSVRDRERVLHHRPELQVEDLRRRFDGEVNELRRFAESEAYQILKDDLVSDLARQGLVVVGDEGLEVSALLVDAFARILLDEELEFDPASGPPQLSLIPSGDGDYEPVARGGPFDRLDLMNSVINSKLNHPGDPGLEPEDLVYFREERRPYKHVVLLFDKSYSMADGERLLAAKKTALALYKALREEDERNIVDLVGFDTGVHPYSLLDVWQAEAEGFTNIAGALALARSLLIGSTADTKHVYLVTDGRPEAIPTPDGDRLVEPAEALKVTLVEASMLAAVREVGTTFIQLAADDEELVAISRQLSERMGGRLVLTTPDKLLGTVVGDATTSVSSP